MKRNLLFTLLLFVAIFTGCNHNEDIVVEHSRVTLEASHNSATRVTFDGQKSTWEDGDCLSVVIDGLEGVYAFNYDATTGSKFGCDNLTMPADQNDVYAFYGVADENIDVANKTATVKLGAAEQTQGTQTPAAHIAEYDVLYGKAESANRNNIQIAMNHTIAAVKINIANSLQDAPTIKSVTITAPEEVALAGEYVLNPSTDEITLADDAEAVNSVNLTFEEPVLLGSDGCVAWIATAPVALVEGDNLVIDITTVDDKVYRCTKQIPADGVSFGAGRIMSTNITIGGSNASLVEPEPDLPATIEIVIDPEAGITLPENFPTANKDNVKRGKYNFGGYEFSFDSSVPFYYNASKSSLDVIRFDGITKTKTASILLPRIDGYVLNKVVLASIDDNRTLRSCCFAVLGSLSDEITTKNSQILTSKHTEFEVSSSNTDCYIYVFHKNSDTGKKADISYISLSYSKIE